MGNPTYAPFRNGQYGGSRDQGRKIVGSMRDGPFGFIPFSGTHGIQDWIWWIDPCFVLPVAANATLTVTNSGTVTTAAAGLTLTTGAADGNNTTIQWIRSMVPAAGKRFAMFVRMKWPQVITTKGGFGLMNTCADPVVGTAPTDGVWFSKDTGTTGAIKANFRGASTTVTATTIHTAVLATEYEYGLVYTATSATDGYCSFWQRAADAEGWGSATQTMTATSTKGLANALRPTFNLDASDSGGAQTIVVTSWGCAFEL